jgi:GDP-4-dehydro-6-deoxy-D-mannose reductase
LEGAPLTRRLLVTGATGFVGIHLLKALDRSGHRIYGTSFPHEPDGPGLSCECRICRLDIRDRDAVMDLVADIRPDWVFHLAAVSNVKHSWEKRSETLETNLLGTLHVLEAIRSFAPDARMLFVSSSNVYREVPTPGQGLSESDAVRPVSPYAFSKISGEMLCGLYADVEGLDIVISRAFPHTGPGQSPDFVCSDWARQIARIEKGKQRSVIRVGNLAVSRDFCDVRDVVKAYVRLLEVGESKQIYNVASGTAVQLRGILDRLLSLSPLQVDVQVDPRKLRPSDISRLCGDFSKLSRATGWEPAIPLEQTLVDLLEYWREKL